MLEKEIENYFKSKIKYGWFIKLNSSSMKGLPDRMWLFPNGIIYFIEFKAPGKKPRPSQEYVIKRLKEMGFQVFIIDNKEKALEVAAELQQNLKCEVI